MRPRRWRPVLIMPTWFCFGKRRLELHESVLAVGLLGRSPPPKREPCINARAYFIGVCLCPDLEKHSNKKCHASRAPAPAHSSQWQSNW